MFTNERNDALDFHNVDLEIPYILIDRIKKDLDINLWIFSIDLYSKSTKFIQGDDGYISKKWFSEHRPEFREEIQNVLTQKDFDELESAKRKINLRRKLVSECLGI